MESHMLNVAPSLSGMGGLAASSSSISGWSMSFQHGMSGYPLISPSIQQLLHEEQAEEQSLLKQLQHFTHNHQQQQSFLQQPMNSTHQHSQLNHSLLAIHCLQPLNSGVIANQNHQIMTSSIDVNAAAGGDNFFGFSIGDGELLFKDEPLSTSTAFPTFPTPAPTSTSLTFLSLIPLSTPSSPSSACSSPSASSLASSYSPLEDDLTEAHFTELSDFIEKDRQQQQQQNTAPNLNNLAESFSRSSSPFDSTTELDYPSPAEGGPIDDVTTTFELINPSFPPSFFGAQTGPFLPLNYTTNPNQANNELIQVDISNTKSKKKDKRHHSIPHLSSYSALKGKNRSNSTPNLATTTTTYPAPLNITPNLVISKPECQSTSCCEKEPKTELNNPSLELSIQWASENVERRKSIVSNAPIKPEAIKKPQRSKRIAEENNNKKPVAKVEGEERKVNSEKVKNSQEQKEEKEQQQKHKAEKEEEEEEEDEEEEENSEEDSEEDKDSDDSSSYPKSRRVSSNRKAKTKAKREIHVLNSASITSDGESSNNTTLTDQNLSNFEKKIKSRKMLKCGRTGGSKGDKGSPSACNFRLQVGPHQISVLVLRHQGMNGCHPKIKGHFYFQARVRNCYPQRHLWAGWETREGIEKKVIDMLNNE